MWSESRLERITTGERDEQVTNSYWRLELNSRCVDDVAITVVGVIDAVSVAAAILERRSSD